MSKFVVILAISLFLVCTVSFAGSFGFSVGSSGVGVGIYSGHGHYYDHPRNIHHPNPHYDWFPIFHDPYYSYPYRYGYRYYRYYSPAPYWSIDYHR